MSDEQIKRQGIANSLNFLTPTPTPTPTSLSAACGALRRILNVECRVLNERKAGNGSP